MYKSMHLSVGTVRAYQLADQTVLEEERAVVRTDVISAIFVVVNILC